jgi:membrane associated rhomboid family serine protease
MIPLHDNVPTRRFPIVTVVLIVLNFAVFAWELRAPPQDLREVTTGQNVRVDGFDAVTAEYGFVPCELQGSCEQGANTVEFAPQVFVRVHEAPVIFTIFSSMFMHGGWQHILGNMLFLWIFGNNIEDRCGRLKFVLFYLAGGLAAAGLQYVTDASSMVPNIGASGAIAAVLGGYLLLYPRASVITYLPPIFFFPLPAMLFLVIWFLLQVANSGIGQVGTQSGGVAYFAHIGGFLFGLLTIRLWTSREPARPRFG